jgi:alcohol dehydrogenase class IV
MKNNFFFQINSQMFFSVGKTREITQLVDIENSCVVILVDEKVAKHNTYYVEIKKIVESSANSVIEILLQSNEEPSYDYLDNISEKVRYVGDIDFIIAIGGGSTLDLGKAVAALVTNPGAGINYRGFDQLEVPPVPSICIPTTAGTGSEVTINAVFTDKKEMKKLGINGRYMNATYAILDALWLDSCPENISVSAGMDAMVHTLESFMTSNANPVTRSFNREAFVILYNNLPAIVDDQNNTDAKQALLLGAYLAAIGLFNSGSGIAGALSYPIGVHYKVPHGIGGGIFISSVVEYNVRHGYYEYAELLDLIEPHLDWSNQDKAERFAEVIKELSVKMKVPETLCQWGINKDNVEEAAKLMLPLQAAFDQNPVAFSAEKDALDILNLHVN